MIPTSVPARQRLSRQTYEWLHAEAATAIHAGNLNGQEMDHDFLDMLGSAPLGRAASVLDVPRVPPSGDALEPEPYMPQWQSESVPAELPNHVVNRLLMGGNGISTRCVFSFSWVMIPALP